MFKALFSFVATICLLMGGYLYFHLGFYKSARFHEATKGPLYLLYKDHLGPYFQISIVIDQVEKAAIASGLPCKTSFGEFLDDPKKTDQDRLRSRAGCVLSSLPAKTPEGLKLETKPAQKYLVGEFDGSPAIGPYKVYPKAKEYFIQRRWTPYPENMEFYTVDGEMVHTEYLFPIASH